MNGYQGQGQGQYTDLAAVFDGSLQGFLAVVYSWYYDKFRPVDVVSDESYQPILGTEYVHVQPDDEKAYRVERAVREKISHEAWENIYKCYLAAEDDRFMDMLRYIVLGFECGHSVDDREAIDYVLRIHRIARYVGGEAHLLSGFARFAETTAGVYYADIGPVNHVLPILAEHFLDRLRGQPWIIHDVNRRLAAVYDGKESYAFAETPKGASFEYAKGEIETQKLWQSFFETITIQPRKNKKLQRQHLPLRYRKYMTEFKKIDESKNYVRKLPSL